jgi:uncharacterized protein (DUF2062 family)
VSVREVRVSEELRVLAFSTSWTPVLTCGAKEVVVMAHAVHVMFYWTVWVITRWSMGTLTW